MIQFFRTTILAGILATAWNCSESAATQNTVSKSQASSTFQIPQDIAVSETSYFFQIGTNYYIIAPTSMTVNDGFGKIIGTFNTATGAILSLSGEIIAINLDLSKLPIVAPRDR